MPGPGASPLSPRLCARPRLTAVRAIPDRYETSARELLGAEFRLQHAGAVRSNEGPVRIATLGRRAGRDTVASRRHGHEPGWADRYVRRGTTRPHRRLSSDDARSQAAI